MKDQIGGHALKKSYNPEIARSEAWELVTGDNEYRDKNNVLCFAIPQHYMLPVNDPEKKQGEEDGSVTYSILDIKEGVRVISFYHKFRRWLKSMGIDPVEYCYQARLPEVLQCGELPDPR